MCPHCDKSFKYLGQLERHLRAHLGARSHICEACGRSFMDERALRAHRRATHLDPRRRRMEIRLAGGAGVTGNGGDYVDGRVYGCELCDKVFQLRGFLMRHLRSEEHREREARRAVQDIIKNVKRKQRREQMDQDHQHHHQLHRQQQQVGTIALFVRYINSTHFSFILCLD